MDPHVFKSANAFCLLYKRAFSDKLAVASMMDPKAAKPFIDAAAGHSDPELVQAAKNLAALLKIHPEAKSGPLPQAPTPKGASSISEAQWQQLSQKAIAIAGPIGAMLCQKARDKGSQNLTKPLKTSLRTLEASKLSSERQPHPFQKRSEAFAQAWGARLPLIQPEDENPL